MPEEEKTPVQIADERLADLEAKSEGYLEGLKDKVAGSFWDRVKEFFVVGFALVWNGAISTFKSIFEDALTSLENRAKPYGEKDVSEDVDKIVTQTLDPKVALKELRAYARIFPFVSWILGLVHILLGAVGLITATLSATWEKATQVILSKERPSLLPSEATIEAHFKDPALQNEVKDILDRMGLSDKFQEMLWTATTAPLDDLSARNAYLRNIIDEQEINKVLKAHHLSDNDISIIKQLYEIIPPVSDIITMAVREVFTPSIVERFGQMQDLPPDFVEWAKKQGLSEYWAKAYWAAHWALPSVMQGFEMLHRRVIGEGDLELLLRALDVMPFWRDKLTAISYRPLTRVDVRRMYGLGVLERQGVHDAYLDVGYSEENAALMTEFTIAFVAEKERELTKTDIIALYKKFAITRESATDMLENIGYYPDTTELLMIRADLEIYATYKKENIKYTKTAYVAGKITEGEALSRLGKLDMPASEVNNLMESWELARESKVKDLTIENLKAFYVAGVITTDELRKELGEIGYNNEDINRFVALFGVTEEE